MQPRRRAVGLIAFLLILVIAGMLAAALHFKKKRRCAVANRQRKVLAQSAAAWRAGSLPAG